MRRLFAKPITLVAAILFLESIALRFIGITRGFDYDEIYTALSANPALSWGYILKRYLLIDVHPPLHNFITWIWNHIFPYGPEWIGRLPSLFFGIAALLVAWHYFPTFLDKKHRSIARWIFVLLLGFNETLIIYTSYMRAYSLLLLLSISFTFLYLNMIHSVWEKTPITRRQWILYACLSVLLCYTHYFGALLFGLCSVILFLLALKYKQEIRWFIYVPLLVFICFLPWLWPNLWENIGRAKFSGQWWSNIWWEKEIPSTWNLADYKSTEFWHELCSNRWGQWTIGLLCVFCAGISYERYRKIPYTKEIILLLIPGLLVFTVNILAFRVILLLMFRYFIPFIPAVFLAISLLLAPVFSRFRWMILLILLHCICYLLCFAKQAPYGFDYLGSNARFFATRMMHIQPANVYTITVEGFPKHTYDDLFSWYLRTYFKSDIPAKDITILPANERNAILGDPTATLYMMMFEDWKLEKLNKEWNSHLVKTRCMNGFCQIKNLDVLPDWPPVPATPAQKAKNSSGK